MQKHLEVLLNGARFAKLVDAQMQEIKEIYGIKKVEIDVLYYLSQCDDLNTSKDICTHLSITKGHVSQAVDQLLKKEYIISVPDLSDHRYIHYHLAEKAAVVIKDIVQRKERITSQTLKNLTIKELAYLNTIASKICENVDNMYNEYKKSTK